MLSAPLADCTVDTFQEANKANNIVGGALRKDVVRKLHTHNPYSRVILTPLFACDMPSEKRVHEHSSNLRAFIPTEVPWDIYPPHPYSATFCADETPHGYDAYGSVSHHIQPMSHFCANPAQSSYQSIQDSTASANTSGIADKAVNLSNSNVSCGNTGTSVVSTPMRRSNNIYKLYVDGRPKVVRGITYAEVRVELRLGSDLFVVDDVPQIFGIILKGDELVGRHVIVEGDRGEDMGRIVSIECCEQLPAKNIEEEERQLLRVLRDALPEEIESFHSLNKLEEEALEFCKNAIHSLKMRTPLEVRQAIFQFDRKKLTFTYSSDSYVEFKTLLRTLNRQYQCRIWMHQLNWEANCRPRRHLNETNSHAAAVLKTTASVIANNNRKSVGNCRRRVVLKKDRKRSNDDME